MAKYVSANTAPMDMDIGNTATDTSASHTACSEDSNWKVRGTQRSFIGSQPDIKEVYLEIQVHSDLFFSWLTGEHLNR